ncbi:hypothetical protein [Pyramidobacter sp. C12-8]|uniref:hypothetical protein n=1 Tax=Pyramidobacter sp. C12-8 TaxID=1943580 RepID=UPI00098FC29A|nr:hypothetical protein [Pyramidobacter sp. C12-8]OON87809.1 hypothetical protein B0D78_09380 [Pyramidobacter sp. C12-8]
MRHEIVFDHFGEDQRIYFDIGRLAALEKLMGTSIQKIIAEGNVGINFVLFGLTVGLGHHYGNRSAIQRKLEEYFAAGGDLNEIAATIVRAVVASGIFGKAESADPEPDEKNDRETQSER